MPTQAVELHDNVTGTGSPLILLHSLYGAGNHWGNQAKWLSAQWQVHTPDLRNHGHSPHSSRMDYEAMASDIGALLDRYGHDDAVVMGHGMGGKVAMTLALAHPRRVRGLVICDVAPVAYSDDVQTTLNAMASVDFSRVTGRRDVDEQLGEYIADPGVRQFVMTNLERAGDEWQWRIPVNSISANLANLQGFPDFDARSEPTRPAASDVQKTYRGAPVADDHAEDAPEAKGSGSTKTYRGAPPADGGTNDATSAERRQANMSYRGASVAPSGPEEVITWDGPTLVVYGERSGYVSDPGNREQLQRYFPASEFQCLAKAGHFLHVEAAETFHEVVRDWLDRFQ